MLLWCPIFAYEYWIIKKKNVFKTHIWTTYSFQGVVERRRNFSVCSQSASFAFFLSVLKDSLEIFELICLLIFPDNYPWGLKIIFLPLRVSVYILRYGDSWKQPHFHSQCKKKEVNWSAFRNMHPLFPNCLQETIKFLNILLIKVILLVSVFPLKHFLNLNPFLNRSLFFFF